MTFGLRRRSPVEVVTLVTRVGCHLCEQAAPVVARLAAQSGARYEERDVDAAPDDHGRYSDKVPVVLLDGIEHAYWQIDEKALRRALRG